ncbi:MAG: bifunctional UDP-N-acetylmuramoyl-tripeptide:D-alanyl-D-alanine ligase/alanine racemase, partial [Bacteroidaceae bacterium]|nr:bifunctional UDP-N-acetylmuramoyl-tripeptide:D-alanyl-D-alanine ligase/alanine racemase [Bacteroidaceae bacterium]
MEQISTIIDWLNPNAVEGPREGTVEHLLTDSRSLAFPETTLFFAIRTATGDGHRYIPDLIRRGVRYFVIQGGINIPDDPSLTFIYVRDSLKALQRVAACHRRRFNIPVIGITGSNGKTTVKEFLYQMLSPDYVVTRSPRSYNSQIGVPLSVWGIHEGTQIAIIEAGISKPGEMKALHDIIRPTIGVFTGIGQAHQENFASYEEKCQEKQKLFTGASDVFYIGDNFKGTPYDADLTLCTNVCRYLGMDEKTVRERAANVRLMPMRMEVMSGRNGCVLINDSYSNDLESLHTALDFVCRRPETRSTTRVLILSDMEQTGMTPRQMTAAVRRAVKAYGIDVFIGIGPVLSQMKRNKDFQVIGFPTTEDFLASCLGATLHNSIVFIKGARSYRFERITATFMEKVHETVLEVNLPAVVENLN